MKQSLLLLTFAVGAFAQSAPPKSGTTVTLSPTVVEEHPAAASATPLSRIDLDFKGGPPAALIEAISKALGKQVNVIVGEEDAQVRLPPIRVRNATITDVFAALASAMTREVNVPVGRDSYQTRIVKSQFTPTSDTLTDEMVWSFHSNEPETQQVLAKFLKESPKPALRHYQLGFYLSDKVSVEDITTTIRTGWEMLGIKDQPELKFHKETGILIAAGNAELLDQIPMVLQQLPQERGGNSVPAPVQVPPRIPPQPRSPQNTSFPPAK